MLAWLSFLAVAVVLQTNSMYDGTPRSSWIPLVGVILLGFGSHNSNYVSCTVETRIADCTLF